MAYQWAVFKQSTIPEEYTFTTVSVFDSEQEAYDEQTRLNKAKGADVFAYWVGDVGEPDDILEDEEVDIF